MSSPILNIRFNASILRIAMVCVLALAAAPTVMASVGGDEIGDEDIKPGKVLIFNVAQNDSVVDIEWITNDETNTLFYTLEKTIDGVDFEIVGSVNSTNEGKRTVYSLVDPFPEHGLYYYRLSQTLSNHKIVLHDLHAFKMQEESNVASPIIVLVKDSIGKEMYAKILVVGVADDHIVGVDPESNLPDGMYTISASSMTELNNLKLAISKAK